MKESGKEKQLNGSYILPFHPILICKKNWNKKRTEHREINSKSRLGVFYKFNEIHTHVRV